MSTIIHQFQPRLLLRYWGPCLAVAGFLSLRLYQTRGEALSADEIISYPSISFVSLHSYMASVLERSPPVTPLYFVLQFSWVQLVGDRLEVLRTLPLLLESLAALGVTIFAYRLFGRLSAALVLALIAASQTHQYYSVDLRMYSLTFLLVCLSMWSIYQASGDKRPLWLGLNLLFNGLALWSHLLTLCMLPAQLLFAWRHMEDRAHFKLWCSGAVSIFLAGFMWYVCIDMTRMNQLSSWIPAVSAERILSNLLWTQAFAMSLPAISHVWLNPLLLVLLACAAFHLWQRGLFDGNRQRALVLLWCWLLLPNLLMASTPLLGTNAYTPRYYLASSYAAFLLLAGIISAWPQRTMRGVMALTVLGLCVVQIHLSLREPLRTQWSQAAALISSEGSAADRVFSFTGEYKAAFSHYTGIPEHRIMVIRDWDTVGEETKSAFKQGKDTWLLLPSTVEPPEDLVQSVYPRREYRLPGSMYEVRLVHISRRKPRPPRLALDAPGAESAVTPPHPPGEVPPAP